MNTVTIHVRIERSKNGYKTKVQLSLSSSYVHVILEETDRHNLDTRTKLASRAIRARNLVTAKSYAPTHVL